MIADTMKERRQKLHERYAFLKSMIIIANLVLFLLMAGKKLMALAHCKDSGMKSSDTWMPYVKRQRKNCEEKLKNRFEKRLKKEG